MITATDEDLKALETCLEVADPGEAAPMEDQETWRRAVSLVEGMRKMVPEGSSRQLAFTLLYSP